MPSAVTPVWLIFSAEAHFRPDWSPRRPTFSANPRAPEAVVLLLPAGLDNI